MSVWVYASACSYMLVAAVSFAGMILTPTESSRHADDSIRQRLIHSTTDEAHYLAVKLFVAIFWPWFLIRSYFK